VTEIFRSPALVLEQSSAARHVSTVIGHLSQFQDSSLQALLLMTLPLSCARQVTCHYGRVNRFSYLLLYYRMVPFPMTLGDLE